MTLIQEKLLGARIHQENLDQHFPTITLCNLKPLASNHKEIARNHSIPTLEDYVNYLKLLWSKNRSDVVQILLSSGSLYTGYYSYIGPENAAMLGHQMDSYIVDCNFIVARGLQVSLEPCYKLSSNRTIPSTKYFNCYQMLYLAEDDASSTAVGISFILQHDNIMVDIPDAGPFNNLLWSQNVGSKLLMHPNNTIFDERTQGFSITVGQYSEVQMSGISYERLPKPYGNCSKQPTNPIYMKNGDLTNYAFNPCTRACIVRIVSDECGCLIAPFMERPWPKTPEHLQSCDYINQTDKNGFDAMKKQFACQENIKSKYYMHKKFCKFQKKFFNSLTNCCETAIAQVRFKSNC